MNEVEKPPPEEVEKAIDGLLGSLARNYGMDKREVLGVVARKYGGDRMADTKKAAEDVRHIEGLVGTGSPVNRLMEFEVLDEIRDRRELRRKEREKKIKQDEEDDDMAKGSSGGFDMDKLMQFMMMKAMMKDMGGGEKNETIEIMKLKILMGGDSSKMDMARLEETMKAEREASREDRERMLEVFTDKQEKDTWMKYMEDRDKRQEERDAVFLEEFKNLRRPAAEGAPLNKIVAAAEELTTARKSLETVGALKPETSEEREHALKQAAAATEVKREENITKFIGDRLNNIEKGVDRKIDMLLGVVMNQQRMQAAQMGVSLPVDIQPQQPGPQQAPQPGTIPREELYNRMVGPAGQQSAQPEPVQEEPPQ